MGGTVEGDTMTNTKKALAPGQRIVGGIFGVIQAAYAFLAFWDLSHRPVAQMHGPKPLWAAVILINWIGPTAYFYVHRPR